MIDRRVTGMTDSVRAVGNPGRKHERDHTAAPGRALIAGLTALALAGCAVQPPPRIEERFAALVQRADTATSFPGPVPLQAGEPADGRPGPRPAYVERGNVRIRMPAASGPATSPDGGPVEMTFHDSDIRDFVRTVLGDMLGLAYSVDPRIEGSVTLETRGSMPRDQILPLLERTLQMHGAALAPFPGGFQVVPADSVLQAGVPLSAGPGATVRAIPLRHVPAKDLAALLAPIVPKGAVVQPEDRLNLLVLAGTRPQLDMLETAVEAFDIDRLSGMSFALKPLQYAAPAALAQELGQIFSEGGEVEDVRFVPLDRLGAVVVVTRDPAQLDRMLRWVERLDQEGGGATPELFVYAVQNGRATDLAATLGQVFGMQTGQTSVASPIGDIAPGYGGGIGGLPFGEPAFGTDAGGGAADAPAAMTAMAPQPAAGPAMSAMIPAMALGGRSPTEGSSAMSGLRVIADEQRNALVVFGTRQQYRTLETALRQLDVVPMQVMIEATIAEVSLQDELSYGLQWFFQSGRFSTLLTRSSSGSVSPSVPGFSAVFDGVDARVVLNALSSLTDVRVISSPQVLALNNQTATLQVGDSVPIPVQQAVNVADRDSVIVNSIQFQDTGVTLEVTPRINEGGLVTLEIDQNVSDAVRTTSSGIDAPTIQKRRISSVVAVQAGETVGLGGLIRDSSSAGNSGVPVLSRMPVVGPLFGTRTMDGRRTELLVLLTPHVIQTPLQARQLTNELRSRMLGMQPLPPRT